MKGLKIFSWICFGLALISLIPGYFISSLDMRFYDEHSLLWQLAALIFALAAVLSLLVVRALKQIKDDLELKMLMNQ
jgi:hypothetical protein